MIIRVWLSKGPWGQTENTHLADFCGYTWNKLHTVSVLQCQHQEYIIEQKLAEKNTNNSMIIPLIFHAVCFNCGSNLAQLTKPGLEGVVLLLTRQQHDTKHLSTTYVEKCNPLE